MGLHKAWGLGVAWVYGLYRQMRPHEAPHGLGSGCGLVSWFVSPNESPWGFIGLGVWVWSGCMVCIAKWSSNFDFKHCFQASFPNTVFKHRFQTSFADIVFQTSFFKHRFSWWVWPGTMGSQGLEPRPLGLRKPTQSHQAGLAPHLLP